MIKVGIIKEREQCDEIEVHRDDSLLYLHISQEYDWIRMTPMQAEELLDILKKEFES